MIRRWIAAHKPVAITAISGGTIAALLVTVAVTSSGYLAQQLDLDGAAVWVTSQTKGMLGRANTQISQLNSVVAASSSSVDVVQSGNDVLLVDTGSNTIGAIDPATNELGKSVPLPPKEAAVHLAGDVVAIDSEGTGQLWLTPMRALESFDARTPPTIDLGGAIVSTADPSGRFFAYSHGANAVYRVDAAHDDVVSRTDALRVPSTSRNLAMTAVGGDWALLDSDEGAVHTSAGKTALPGWLGSDTVVQQPTDASGPVYVASATGLVAVARGGGEATTLVRGSFGAPAAPIVVDGCVYAAWSDGATFTRCHGDAKGVSSTLPAQPTDATLAFRTNGRNVVLNDTISGRSWDVRHGWSVIDNWEDFTHHDTTDQTVEQNDTDTPPTYEKAQQPPVATDDTFGARPGAVSRLPVLLNDYDPNGDVLVISAVDGAPAAPNSLDLVNEDQQLQLTLAPDATGSFAFRYTITDGRGGSATATVTVQVRTPEENSPPVQVHATKATVAAGGRATTQVLGDWYDPDGDPFYLASASVEKPDTVSFTPEGAVVYSDASAGGTLRTIALTVSDSRASGRGKLSVTVHNGRDVPIIAEPFVASTMTGHELTVAPLTHVRGGSGTLRVSAVTAKQESTITPDYDKGTFRFSSDHPGTHLVDYTVTDGLTTANGTVRIEVKAPPDGNTRPITVPHTAFIHEQSTQEIDVLATDIDPAGGVLLITGVSNVPPDSGVRVEVLQHHLLRITLTRPIEHPVQFAYTVSNGLAEATGTVSVVQIARPAVRQPPVANPDTVSVRVGDAIDIPVLANDTQPDGDDLTLEPTLATALPSGAGLLFASGNVLRYLAPHTPGNYTAAYRVDAPDGQWASAQVTIAVRELDTASNNPPVPQTVTSRVLAGEKVRISIPLDGIDPDGDSVKLVGQVTNPDKGAVTAVGTDWIEYTAGEYSSGLDTFEYSVVDTLGARATGVVRVGIAAAQSAARNPVAVEDEVTVRPGHTVSVQVLANDSDPDNSPLHITAVKPTAGRSGTAKVAGDLVRVTAPKAEGRYGFIYEIQNDTGGTSSNFLTVVVRADAPLARPHVDDSVLGLSDIIGKSSVNVNVLANVFFADGPVNRLELAVLHPKRDSAHVTTNKRVRVQIKDTAQIIPFSVTHPDDASIVSYGFIWVPGTNDALPQLKRGVRRLTVPSEKTLTIHLNDYVVAIGGKKVRLTDASTVHATHANGNTLVRDDDTLVFTSADRYFGPASISFEVTDGTAASDSDAHVATLVLPIAVTPRDNQPPVFTGGQIDFEPGQQKTIDLLKLTRYPYAKDRGELRYRVLDPRPDGFAVSIDGTKLSVRTAEKTKQGMIATLLIGVRDSVNNGQAGRISLTVVPSTRPIAAPAADSVIVRRGATSSIDVLANDQATNPFPATPLRVVAVRGLENGSLPAGVAVRPSDDKSRLSVSVTPNAQPTDTNLQYEVADATGDPARYAWGTVRISVQDKPDPVADLRVTSIGDRALTLSWAAGAANNSPITDYAVTLTRVSDGQATTTRCTTTTCSVPTPGNGPQNAVTASVVAHNAIGASEPVAYSDAVFSNVVPPAPAIVSVSPVDHGARLTWNAPTANTSASAVTAYRVSLGSATIDVPASHTSATITDPGAANGSAIAVSVAAMNRYYGAEPTWNADSAVVTPAGAPLWTGAPTASAEADGSGAVTVSWAGALNANGAALTSLVVYAYQHWAPQCGSSGGTQVDPQAGSATMTGLDSNQSWKFAVAAINAQGCSMSQEVSATPLAPPTNVTLSAPSPASPSGAHYLPTLSFAQAVGDVESYRYQLVFQDGSSYEGPVSGAGSARQVDVGPGAYGKVITRVRVQSVLSSGTTSDWSAAASTSVVAVDLAADVQADGAAFTWTHAPAGAGYSAVTYQCTGQAEPAAMPDHGSCTASGGNPTLTVRVAANGETYEKIYRG